MYYKIFRTNKFLHCNILDGDCDCKVPRIPEDDKKNFVHFGIYIWPEKSDDICVSIENILKKDIKILNNKCVFAKVFLTYSNNFGGDRVISAYKVSDISMHNEEDYISDISTEVIYHVNKSISEVLDNDEIQELDEDIAHGKILDNSTIYLDLCYCLEPIKISLDDEVDCPLTFFVKKSIMSAKYVGMLQTEEAEQWNVSALFSYLRGLYIKNDNKTFELTFHGRRNGIKRVD